MRECKTLLQYVKYITRFYRATPTSAVCAVVVCLSVCLSVTSRCSAETAKRRISQTAPHDIRGNLVFEGVHPQRRRQMQVGLGWLKLVTFDK